MPVEDSIVTTSEDIASLTCGILTLPLSDSLPANILTPFGFVKRCYLGGNAASDVEDSFKATFPEVGLPAQQKPDQLEEVGEGAGPDNVVMSRVYSRVRAGQPVQ